MAVRTLRQKSEIKWRRWKIASRSVRMIKMHKLRWIALSFLVGALTGIVAQLAYTHLHRGSYEDCILEHEPHASDRIAAYTIYQACEDKYHVYKPL